ncbi:MAG: recombination mediator RecR [Patescibacteria group bacterium]
MFPPHIQKLIAHFQKLPGIGPRQAAKFALRLVRMTPLELKSMAEDVAMLKDSIGECQECFLLFDRPKNGADSSVDMASKNLLCQFCRDPKRDHHKISVVATDHDALAIEKTKSFAGVYHVLGGYVDLLKKKEDRLKPSLDILKSRLARAEKEKTEIILAFSSTTEGQATVLYLEKELNALGIKISRLARGLSTGSEIEYADDETLINALKHRR